MAIKQQWSFKSSCIPEALKQENRWAPWRATWNEKRGKWDKIPHRADNPNYGLSTAKPDQWFSYDTAVNALTRNGDKFAGVGYCMTGPHGIVAVDMDGCVDELGIVADWAQEVIGRLESYTEISPSGNGIRIMARGVIQFDWTNHDVGIEVYGGHEARFLTMTGNVIPGFNDMRSVDDSTWSDLQQTYAREKRKAEVIDLCVPDLLDDLVLPDLDAIHLSKPVRKFIESGEFDTDRSGTLHNVGIALYAAGLTDAEVFSVMVGNPFCMGVALDHRRQDNDRAMLYLWREHCVKAKPKAQSMVASVDEFELVAKPTTERELPKFRRHKDGNILATVENVTMAVARPDLCGVDIRFDTFRDEVMYSIAEREEWQPFLDVDYVRLRIALEKGGFMPIGRELIRDVVLLVASENSFDSAQLWLSRLKWDGVPRVATFLCDYFGTEDTEYTRSVSTYLWSAMAGRVVQPGVKADMAPILVGEQGKGKSTAVSAMVPSMNFFKEISFDEKDDDLKRKMRGTLIAEIGELRGLHTKELEAIKSFITRTHETWIPKYKEFEVQFPRRLVFIGTTNKEEFLADETGNRRWLPVRVGDVDVAGIRRDHALLWAEAKVLFDEGGVHYKGLEKLAEAVHDEHTIHDSWCDVVNHWLDTPDDLTGEIPRTRKFLRVSEVLVEALGFVERNISRKEETRMSATFRTLGYVRKKSRVNGKSVWGFVPLL